MYQSKGRSSRGSRRPSTDHEETQSRPISATGEIRISALGHEQTVEIPSNKKLSAATANELADRVTVMQLSNAQKVVCITETKGHIRMINDIARRHNARAVIHTGDFGFYDADSYKHMNVKELRNMVQFGPLSGNLRNKLMKVHDHELQKACHSISFSELSKFISGEERLNVPVYVVWGNQEDVNVINKFADGSYHVPNLYILNQDSSFTIPLDGSTLRLFGLGGAFLYHRFFDIGHGSPTAAGADGVMWSTLIQVGNLIELAERHKDPNEVRVLVTHVSPGKEGLVNVLANAIKADFTFSGALHGKFCHAYTDFSVRTLSNYLEHIGMAQVEIPRLWAHVVQALGESNIRESDRHAVERVLAALKRSPQTEADLKHIWHLNLADAKHGHLLFAVTEGQLKVETIVDHGWSLSGAREHPRRRSSLRPSIEHKSKETVAATEPNKAMTEVSEPEMATLILNEVPASDSKFDSADSKINAAFVVKITGFAAGTTQAELDQKFALKFYKVHTH